MFTCGNQLFRIKYCTFDLFKLNDSRRSISVNKFTEMYLLFYFLNIYDLSYIMYISQEVQIYSSDETNIKVSFDN